MGQFRQRISHREGSREPMHIPLFPADFLGIFRMSAEFSHVVYRIAVCLSDACRHKKVFQQMICQHMVYLIATSLLSSAPILSINMKFPWKSVFRISDPDMPGLFPSSSRPIPLIGHFVYSQISVFRKILDYPVTDIPGLDVSITLRALCV